MACCFICGATFATKKSVNQYLKFVRPVYFKYIMPTKQYADIVIKNNYDSHLDEFADDFLLNMKL